MKVLHLIATLATGGAERQVALLAANMAASGITTGICFHTPGPNFRYLSGTNLAVYRLTSRSNHDPRLIFDILDVFGQFRPSIVQTWLPQMDVLGAVACRLRGIPYVLSERSSANMYARTDWKSRLRVEIGKSAPAIIANSEGGLDYWRAQRARGSLHIVRNALTPPNPLPASLNQFELEGCQFLLAAGRLSPEKNVTVLVKAIAAALSRLPSHHAVIFGDGPEKGAISELIHSTGFSRRIHMGGYTENLAGWMRAADAFISASLIEGHPNVVIEAAAAGCPLVLSDIPAHREFARGNSALFASTSSADGLATALVKCVVEREEAIARANDARRLTTALSIEAAVQQHIEIYQSLICRKN